MRPETADNSLTVNGPECAGSGAPELSDACGNDVLAALERLSCLKIDSEKVPEVRAGLAEIMSYIDELDAFSGEGSCIIKGRFNDAGISSRANSD